MKSLRKNGPLAAERVEQVSAEKDDDEDVILAAERVEGEEDSRQTHEHIHGHVTVSPENANIEVHKHEHLKRADPKSSHE